MSSCGRRDLRLSLAVLTCATLILTASARAWLRHP